MKIKVIIAAHKQYLMPDKDCYLPVQVGSALHKAVGYTPDNTGDNISEKNPYYCELTGLYWAWKNLPADVIGLVHYRRYMGKKNGIVGLIQRYRDPLGSILDGKDIEKLMKKSDIILPKRRKYYIETLYSHYARQEIAEKYAVADCLYASSMENTSEYQQTLVTLYKEARDTLTMCAPEEFDEKYQQYTDDFNDAGFADITEERKAAFEDGNTTRLPEAQKAAE